VDGPNPKIAGRTAYHDGHRAIVTVYDAVAVDTSLDGVF